MAERPDDLAIVGAGTVAKVAVFAALRIAEWEEHYGPETWRRLSDAKKRFDPNNVLTPGPGVFTKPSPG